MDKLAELEKTLDTTLSAYPVFEQVERQTGIRKTHMVAMAGILLLSALLSLVFPGLFFAVLTLAYPLWATAQAADGHDKAEDVQWLSYWICYGLTFLKMDVVAAPLLSRLFSPFTIAVLRSAVLIFLYAPQTRGATLVWHQALRPLLHLLNSACPALSKSASGTNGGMKGNFEKKRADVAKTLSEMRNRSKSGSGDDN